MSLTTETVYAFNNVNEERVEVHNVSENYDYNGTVVIAFGDTKIDLDEEDIQDLQDALAKLGY